jgi:DNA-directed RNA polymerase subunit M/transcription elongation factor TFIIS
MRCKRCNGLMIVESSIEDECEEQLAGRGALRCINCGAMVTVRMLRNLAARQAERIKTLQPTGVYARHAKRTMCLTGAFWEQCVRDQ